MFYPLIWLAPEKTHLMMLQNRTITILSDLNLEYIQLVAWINGSPIIRLPGKLPELKPKPIFPI